MLNYIYIKLWILVYNHQTVMAEEQKRCARVLEAQSLSVSYGTPEG